MRLLVGVIVGVVVGGGVGLATLFVGQGGGEDKVGKFEQVLSAVKKVENRLSALEEHIAELEDALDTLSARQKGVDATALKQVVAEALQSRSVVGKDTRSREVGGEEIEKRVEKAVERAVKRLAPVPRPRGGKWALAALADALKMDAQTADSFAQIIRDGKRRMLALLRTPKPDGTTVLDDFLVALSKALREQGPDGAKKAFGAFFARLMREKVPGQQTTYFEQITYLRDRTEAEIRRLLGDKYASYAALGIDDPLDKIKVPDDPLESYIQNALKEQMAGEPQN